MANPLLETDGNCTPVDKPSGSPLSQGILDVLRDAAANGPTHQSILPDGLRTRLTEPATDVTDETKLGADLGASAREALKTKSWLEFPSCFPASESDAASDSANPRTENGGTAAETTDGTRRAGGPVQFILRGLRSLNSLKTEDPQAENADRAPETVTLPNGDIFTVGGANKFTLTDSAGAPVTIGNQLPSQNHVFELSNGAIYHSRGQFGIYESIEYQNGDSIRFNVANPKIVSTTINGVTRDYE